MREYVANEIGASYKHERIALVGRAPVFEDARWNRPFASRGGRVLDDCLRERGLRRQDVALLNAVRYRAPGDNFFAHPRSLIEEEITYLRTELDRLRPNVVIALGNEAAYACCAEWPTKDGSAKGAFDVEKRRGFIFDGAGDWKTLVTISPATAAIQWDPWRTLLSFDIAKAKQEAKNGRHIRRPRREIEVVSNRRGARRAVEALRRAGRFACDIENYDADNLACVGFADRADRAFVFPAQFLGECQELLEDRRLTSIWQNGQYDLHFLLTRCGVKVHNRLDDTMILWHAIAPELAGASEESAAGKKKNKASRKSLAFFASLATADEWWKDYEFETEMERFILNGKDCCITLDVFDNYFLPWAEDINVTGIYRHEMDLVWPVVEMLERGLRVDDTLRRERIQAIEGRLVENHQRLQEVVVPLLEERREALGDAIRLFENIEGVCPCCRHAAKKQNQCWSCAGFEKAPSKRALVERWFEDNGTKHPPEHDPRSLKKDELEAVMLGVCQTCGGAPRREWLEFNPRSNDQSKIILYELLKLPKKFNTTKTKGQKKQTLTTNEEALKSLQVFVS